MIDVNKWNLVENKNRDGEGAAQESRRLLPQLRGVRVVPVSGLTGAHVDRLLEAVVGAQEVWSKRVSTGRLNRWLAPVVESTPPPAVAGRRIKIRYITRPKSTSSAGPVLLVRSALERCPAELSAIPDEWLARDV